MSYFSFFDKLFYYVKYKIDKNKLSNPYISVIINDNTDKTSIATSTQNMNKIFNGENKTFGNFNATKKVLIYYHGGDRSFYTIINAISYYDIHDKIMKIAIDSTKYKKKNFCKSKTKTIKSINFVKNDDSEIDIVEIINQFIEVDTNILFDDVCLLMHIDKYDVKSINILYFDNEDFEEKNIVFKYTNQNINIINNYM
jgi:hypothetical protein